MNGTKLHNLHDLVAAVDSSQDPYLVFDLDYAQKVGGCDVALRTKHVYSGDSSLFSPDLVTHITRGAFRRS